MAEVFFCKGSLEYIERIYMKIIPSISEGDGILTYYCLLVTG